MSGEFNPVSSQLDAQILADGIKAYWAKRGHQIKTWVIRSEDTRTAEHRNFYSVRSNLHKGLPPETVYSAAKRSAAAWKWNEPSPVNRPAGAAVIEAQPEGA